MTFSGYGPLTLTSFSSLTIFALIVSDTIILAAAYFPCLFIESCLIHLLCVCVLVHNYSFSFFFFTLIGEEWEKELQQELQEYELVGEEGDDNNMADDELEREILQQIEQETGALL